MAKTAGGITTDSAAPDESSASCHFQNKDVFHVTATQQLSLFELKDVWVYRELLYFLAWRDIKVRYHQTLIGVAWAVVKPLSMMLVFSVFFGWLANMPSDGLPYPIFVFSAWLPWQLFAHIFSGTSHSLVSNQNLITKVSFPRLIIPLSAMTIGIIDFLIALVVLFGIMIYYHIPFTLRTFTVPIFSALAIITALGAGLWISALEVRYRDIGHAIPFVTQLWFFATPVAYSSALIPPLWQTWSGMNPMASVVNGFRWALLGTNDVSLAMLLLSLAICGSVFVSGIYYFLRTETTFADVI